MRVSPFLLLLGSLVTVTACTDELPTSPRTVVAPSTVVASAFPATLKVYEFSRAVSDPVKYSDGSSYWLHEDKGTFTIIYGNDVSFEGTYIRTGDEFAFSFTPRQPDLPSPGPWQATGTLSGNELTVLYSAEMKAKNFEDAVYALLQPRQ